MLQISMNESTKKLLFDLAYAASGTGALFGSLGFIYIAGNAWFHPESLSWPLTHFLPYPREDTFGAFCFGTAVICCFVHLLLKQMHPASLRR